MSPRSSKVHLASVEIFHAKVPFARTFTLGSGNVGDATSDGDVIFVKLTDADGVVGWGEQRALPSWSYETAETIASVIEREHAPMLLDAGWMPPERFQAEAKKRLSPSVSNGFNFAHNAIDIALHDLAGRRCGLSIGELLGGPVYGALPLCSAIGVGSPEEVAEWVTASSDYHAYKVKIKGDVAADAVAVRTVAAHAGGKPIWLDANQSYGPASLHQLLRLIDDVPGLFCIEQPVPSTDWGGMRYVADHESLPVAIDEGSFTAADAARNLALGAAQMVVIKLCKSGGIRQALKTAGTVRALGAELLGSGLTDCGIGFAAALHLFSVLDLALPVELNGPELLDELYVDGLTIEGGIAEVPDGPGLGIDVDETAIRAASERVVMVR